MGKLKREAKELLKQVGGKENIKTVSHCMTRMRFVLFDEKKAHIDEIEKIEWVKGTFTQSGQFQVIIGNNVQVFYNDFIEVSGLENMNKEMTKNEMETNQTWVHKSMGILGEIFAPLIPAIICGGLILGFRNCLDGIKFFENGTKTLCDLYPFWIGVNYDLWLISEAIFCFLPVGIVWSISKKMGTTQILGIVLGLTLVLPQLWSGEGMTSMSISYVPDFNFGYVGYQGYVIPAIMSGFALVYLEKFWRKISPDAISIIIVPFCSIVSAVFISHIVLVPLGSTIDHFMASIIYNGLTSQLKWLIAIVFALLYAPLVMTGLHHITNMIDMQLVNQFQGTILWPMIALSNIAQGSAVLAMIVLQRKNVDMKKNNISACLSCYLGVTEMALFGVNYKYKFPFVCALIGSVIASLFSVSQGIAAMSIGVGGIPGILSIQSEFIFKFIIGILLAVIIPFSLTYIVGKKKLPSEDLYVRNDHIQENEDICSPLMGHVLSLSEVDDKVFSQGLMGKGFAVDLKDGRVVAPLSGEIVMTFPTKHAYGIKRADGLEILIHLGMDTVELNGEGFTCFVEVGDFVKQGDLIAEVDLDFVRSKGKSLVSPVVITSQHQVSLIDVKDIQHCEKILELHKAA